MSGRKRTQFEVVVDGRPLGRVIENIDTNDWSAYDAHRFPVGTFRTPTAAREAIVRRDQGGASGVQGREHV